MSQQLSLSAYSRRIRSPFGLLGTNENALSFALAYTLQQSPELLRWFLGRIGVSGIRQAAFANISIDLQRHSRGNAAHGITDIEIRLPGSFHVIVEAKVGLGVPTIEQCSKYLPRLTTTNEPIQKLVALVQSPDHSFVQRYCRQNGGFSKSLVGFNWTELVPECVRLMIKAGESGHSRPWLDAFYRFLDQEYGMKAFTTEVWILPVDTKPLWPNGMSFWDVHQKYSLYFDATHPTVRPLYLAFRVGGVLDSIYRVGEIEHCTPIVERVPELVNVADDWPKSLYTIWHFGPQIKLANPLRTGGGMYNRRVRCDLDLLLTCKSVQEIEEKMGTRRDATEE